MNAKSKQRWLEYERSLTPPEQAMEELRLRGMNSPGASTSGNLSLNVNRTSRPKAKKKGKLSNNGKKTASGTQEELDAGRIVDPSGSVDPPQPKERFIQNLEIDELKVRDAIKEIKVSKSKDANGISKEIIKNVHIILIKI